MIQDLFILHTEGNTSTTSVTITVTLGNGVFTIDPPSTAIHFGDPLVPPKKTPYGYFTTWRNKLSFSGILSGVRWEIYVQSQDSTLVGSVEVSPVLPIGITITSEGGKGQFILPPGKPGAQFRIPIANAPSEGEAERESRIAKIVGGTE